MNTVANNLFQIWVDADACPAPIKQILYRTARRLQVKLTLVANQSMQIPSSGLIRLITVPEGADVADDIIVEMLAPGDVVITGDIPLAARVVGKSAIAIGVRGELFDDNSVHDRLPAFLKGVKRLLAQDEVPAFIGRLNTVIKQQFPEGSELSVPSHLINAERV